MKKKLIGSLLALALCVSIAACGETPSPSPSPSSPAPSASAPTASAPVQGAAAYTSGTYESESQGNNGPVKVAVTFSDSAITEVKVVSHAETPGVGTVAIDQIPSAIVEHQSLAIDAVTGATNSSNAILTAVAACVEQAGGDAAALKAVTVGKDAKDLDATYDVVVLGGGGAGLTAAISAAQAGSKVVLVEKGGYLGGNTLLAGQGFNAADPALQGNMPIDDGLVKMLKGYLDLDPADLGEYRETLTTVQDQIRTYLDSGATYLFDTPELHMLHCYLGSTRTGLDGTVISPDFDLINYYVHSALDGLDWIASIGGEWDTTTASIVGSMWPRSHFLMNGNVIDILAAAAEDNGVEIMLNTRANTLLTDSGAVVGVAAENSDGGKVTLHANRGVVLATGGFAANAKMVAEYNNYWPGTMDTMMSTNSPNLVGDGINMAKAVGADLFGMGFVQLMPMADPDSGALFTGLWGSAETQFFVNKEGKRYVNEYAERDVLSKAALEQTDGLFYIICDKDEIDYNRSMGELDLDAMEKSGDIFVADTLEELAQKIGLPVDTFLETVKTYNEYCVTGEDPDFGKEFFGTPIDTPPFVATPRSPSLHHTMGGVKIDVDTHVIGTNGQIIKGLYAAGEVTGGIHAGNRLGGNAMTDCVVFGRVAGANAAAGK